MTIEVNLPDDLKLTQKEVLTALAAQLYGAGKLSLGQAAHIARYNKADFMSLLAHYGISVFNFPIDDLESDLANARSYNR